MQKGKRISIVVPVYNSAGWIVRTFNCVERAVEKSDFEAEVIFVDDGSTDGSLEEERSLKSSHLGVRVVDLKNNRGRYLARKAGIEAASSEHILLLDSRVFVHEDSLAYLGRKLDGDMDQIWNGHVVVSKRGNIFARFWNAIVCIAWRKYFGNPREVSYGAKDFDYYPKGTGFFFAPKKVLQQAMRHFEKEPAKNLKFSSDDTLLIRFIASKMPIHLSPQFSCTYHSRSTFGGFVKHAYHRGQFFVDGFLRFGTRFFIPLIGFLAASLIAVVALIVHPLFVAKILFWLALLFVITVLASALFLRVDWRDALSLSVLSLPFAVVYGAGIWRGFLRKASSVFATVR